MNRNWYLIHTKVRQENVAEINLQHLGVETFCPCIENTRSTSSQGKAKKNNPLFPGYIFVRVDISREFRKVSYCRGVIRVVKFGLTPAIVEDEIVNTIKTREKNGLVVIRHPSFKRGQTIVIDNGPFQGFNAIFEQELNGLQRVAILLKTVSFQGRMVIDRSCLALCEDHD